MVGNRRVTNRIRTKGLRSVCFMLHFNELGEGRVRASPLCVLRVREELLARGGARGPAQTAPGAPRTPTRSSSGARTPSELPVEHSLHQGTPSRKCRKPGESPRGKKLFVRNTCLCTLAGPSAGAGQRRTSWTSETECVRSYEQAARHPSSREAGRAPWPAATPARAVPAPTTD